jgi:D-3-phosphoglycerate dehydrogenase
MNFYLYRNNSSSYLSENFHKNEKQVLSSREELNYLNQSQIQSCIKNISSSDRIILLSSTHTTEQNLPSELLNKTDLIIHPNSGYDNLIPWVESSGTPVLLGNPIRLHAVKEYILSCVFDAYSQLPKQAQWDKKRRFDRDLLIDKKVLIYGHGHIGQELVLALTSLTDKITIVDPYHTKIFGETKRTPLIVENNKEIDLEEFDYHILCCSLNAENKKMINKNYLKRVKPKAVLINPARGDLVDITDLKQHLEKTPQFRAYLDVFPIEPFDLSQLTPYPNCYCSSHIAGVNNRIEQQMIDFEQSKINEYIDFCLDDNEDKFFSINKGLILSNRKIQGEFYV